MRKSKTPRTHEILFSKLVAPRADRANVRWGPESAEEKMRIRNEIITAKTKLKTLPLEEGPYADRNEKVQELAEEIGRLTKGDLNEITLALCEILTPVNERVHVHEDSYEIPDLKFFMSYDSYRENTDLPVAGFILDEPRRDIGIGTDAVTVISESESYLLAVSILRRLGFHADKCAGIGMRSKEGEQKAFPMIAITSNEDITLTSLIPGNLAQGIIGIMLMDDRATLADTYSLQADNIAKVIIETYRKVITRVLEGIEREDVIGIIEHDPPTIVTPVTGEVPIRYHDLLVPDVAIPFLGGDGEGFKSWQSILTEFKYWKETRQGEELDSLVDKMAEAIVNADRLWPESPFIAGALMLVGRSLSHSEITLFWEGLEKRGVTAPQQE